jgi:ubiquinone/menaquinone biosynthesis C-methylase UbiE
MAAIDYRKLYDEYWAQPDRWGTHSFPDADVLAERILHTCGGGPLLDVGCGMGLLVRTLLGQGADARGVDVSARAVERGNELAPDRFSVGSVLQLPFSDETFDTVVATDVLEHLSEPDVGLALRELHRVTRRYAFLTVSTTADRDACWHLTVRDRAWWEDRLFETGFRRHPLYQTVVGYEGLEHEGPQVTLILEKIPAAAAARFPLEQLARERLLHMDMLRESGRRADAHVARYMLALPLVRPNDVVLDVACGLGYGAAILASGAPAARVIGVDDSKHAIEYARSHFVPQYPVAEFHRADAARLRFLPDESVDLAVCMETLEHLPDPEVFLREIARVLRPAGRIALSVPNEWTDESGQDPNPHHLHVYTWAMLKEQLSALFLLEKAYAQTAGGSLKCGDQPRRLVEVPFMPASDTQAEWWLAVALKDPVGRDKRGYQETGFPDYRDLPDFHVAAFARDYDDPWLVRAMVSIGQRATNPELLEETARRVCETARAGSADAGAGLCVLGYRMLERGSAAATEIDTLLDRIREYHRCAEATAHAWRWRISNQYIAARLLLLTGRRAAAREAFLECAALDCLKFSPLLATKTVDALFQAGVIAACDGDRAAAASAWKKGLDEVQRVLTGSWVNIWGRPEQPLSFGLPEVAELADLASRCAQGLLLLDSAPVRPGFVWAATNRRSVREQRDWNAKLQKAHRWLEGQCQRLTTRIKEQEEIINRQHRWTEEVERAKGWLEGEWRQLTSRIEQQESIIHEQQTWTKELEKAKDWIEGQWRQLAGQVEEQARVIKEQQDWAQELEKAKDWIEAEWRALVTKVQEQDGAFREQQRWTVEVEQAKNWIEGEWRALAAKVKEQEGALREQQRWTGEVEQAKNWIEGEWRVLAAKVKEQEGVLREQQRWTGEVEKARQWIEEQWEQLKTKVNELEGVVRQQQSWIEEVERAKDRLEGQWRALLTKVKEQEGVAGKLHGRTQQLEQANRRLEEQARQSQARAADLENALREGQARRAELDAALARLRAACARWKQQPLYRLLRGGRLLRDLSLD